METTLNNTKLIVVQGDIAVQNTDAIVNAANSSLILGSGVAGAIKQAGGSTIQAECNEIGYCSTGSAVLTGGGKLKASYVIHAVGPVYSGKGDAELLASAVTKSLSLCDENNIKSVSIPAISSGIYGYPIAESAKVIIDAIVSYISINNTALSEIRLVLYSEKDYSIFNRTLDYCLSKK